MKKKYRYRSAVTGRFVPEAYAKRYPHRTVKERVVLAAAEYARTNRALKAAGSKGISKATWEREYFERGSRK